MYVWDPCNMVNKWLKLIELSIYDDRENVERPLEIYSTDFLLQKLGTNGTQLVTVLKKKTYLEHHMTIVS